MATLRNVSLELARMERAMKAKEAEYFRTKAKPLIQIFDDVMGNNAEFCEKLTQFNREDIRVIVNWIMKNFDTILEGAKPELEEVRAKREKRTAKRKETKRANEQNAEAVRQARCNARLMAMNEEDDDEDWRHETVYEEEYPEELRQLHNQQYGSGNYQG